MNNTLNNSLVNSDKKFQINHTNILKKILISKGWKEGYKDFNQGYYTVNNDNEVTEDKEIDCNKSATLNIENSKRLHSSKEIFKIS